MLSKKKRFTIYDLAKACLAFCQLCSIRFFATLNVIELSFCQSSPADISICKRKGALCLGVIASKNKKPSQPQKVARVFYQMLLNTSTPTIRNNYHCLCRCCCFRNGEQQKSGPNLSDVLMSSVRCVNQASVDAFIARGANSQNNYIKKPKYNTTKLKRDAWNYYKTKVQYIETK